MEDRMSRYRGYFMKDNHIVAPTVIEATDDAEALRNAGELLSTSESPRIEVWQGFRNVGALSAPAACEEGTGSASLLSQQE
jgi:hypothetical protein